MTEPLVPLQKLGTEIEAEIACAALRSGGVRCNYSVSPWRDPVAWDESVDERGPYVVYVAEEDLDRAFEILDEAEVQGERFALEPLAAEDHSEPSNASRAALFVFVAPFVLMPIALIALIVYLLLQEL